MQLNNNNSSLDFESEHRELLRRSTTIGDGARIKKCYLYGLLMTIGLGTIQFGYSIGSWNSANDAYVFLQGWDKKSDKATKFQTFATAFTILGAAIGALFSGPLLKLGRWNCILYTNFLVVAGCALTFFLDNSNLVLIGRFVFGLSCGCFSVFCPKYISEVSPTEIKGPAGALS